MGFGPAGFDGQNCKSQNCHCHSHLLMRFAGALPSKDLEFLLSHSEDFQKLNVSWKRFVNLFCYMGVSQIK